MGKGAHDVQQKKNSSVTTPDGGWGWVVVLSSFLIHVIADGIVYSFGVFLVVFVEYFHSGRGETSWIGSLQPAVTFTVGPLASALTNRYGCRAVTIAGSIIGGAGFVISFFAPNLYFLYFSAGIMAGLGFGLIYLPAIVIVAQYFEKKRAFATGLAVCGSGFGTFVLAPLTEYLLEEFGWRGTMLIVGGILFNAVVCGAVFRPLEASLETGGVRGGADAEKGAARPVEMAGMDDVPSEASNATYLKLTATTEKSDAMSAGEEKSRVLSELPPDLELVSTEKYDRAFSDGWDLKDGQISNSSTDLQLDSTEKSDNLLSDGVQVKGSKISKINVDLELRSAEKWDRHLSEAVEANCGQVSKVNMNLELEPAGKCDSYFGEPLKVKGGQDNKVNMNLELEPAGKCDSYFGEPLEVKGGQVSKVNMNLELEPAGKCDSYFGEPLEVKDGKVSNVNMEIELWRAETCDSRVSNVLPTEKDGLLSRLNLDLELVTLESIEEISPDNELTKSPKMILGEIGATGGGQSALLLRTTPLRDPRIISSHMHLAPPKSSHPLADIAKSDGALQFMNGGPARKGAKTTPLVQRQLSIPARPYGPASSTTASTALVVRPVGSRKDVFYSGSLQHIPMYRSHHDLYIASITSIPTIEEEKAEPECTCYPLSVSSEFREAFREMLSFSLLKNPVFLMFAISNFLTSIGFNMPFIFLPDRAILAGIDEGRAAWLLSAIGISNTVGRVVFGYVADKEGVDRLRLYSTALTICGVATGLSPFVGGNYHLLITYAVVFGIFIGVYVSLTSVVLVDLLGIDLLTNSFGLLLLFQGAATFVGPPIAGWLCDWTGSYDISFHVMGLVIAISGAMLYFLRCVQRRYERHTPPQERAHQIEMGKLETSESTGDQLPEAEEMLALDRKAMQ